MKTVTSIDKFINIVEWTILLGVAFSLLGIGLALTWLYFFPSQIFRELDMLVRLLR
jgi:hypothetical protein